MSERACRAIRRGASTPMCSRLTPCSTAPGSSGRSSAASRLADSSRPRFAATRAGTRRRRSSLASVPAPGWHLRPRHGVYARGRGCLARCSWPSRRSVCGRRCAPRFRAAASGCASASRHARRVLPRARSRRRAWRAARALASSADVARDCARVAAPTLVVTGEPALDRVVPVERTREYLAADSRRAARDAGADRPSRLVTRPELRTRWCATFRRNDSSGPGLTSRPSLPLREIPGPAGPLEALLDEPPSTGVTDGRARPTLRAVVFAHPHPQYGGTMHTKAVFRPPRLCAASAAPCCASISAASGTSAGSFDDGAGENGRLPRRARFHARALSGRPLWAAGMSFGAWIALIAGAADPRVSTLIGIAPPLSTLRLRAGPVEHEAEVLHPGRTRRVCPLEGDAGVLRPLRRAEGARRDRRRRSPVRRASVEVAEAIEDLLAISDWTMMHDAVIVSAVRTAGRQGAERNSARHAARRARGHRDRRSAAPRARASMPAKSTT